ncbi:MAG: FliH/SctL family protein [Candidatus Sericytochromatia bacterium]|nr:FliH/SctL family protein [Candidatus Sericytochromatia bacterium]
MALIKGNKVNPRGTVVLQGDQLLPDEAADESGSVPAPPATRGSAPVPVADPAAPSSATAREPSAVPYVGPESDTADDALVVETPEEPAVPRYPVEPDATGQGEAAEKSAAVKVGLEAAVERLEAWDVARDALREEATALAASSEADALADIDPSGLFRERHAELASHLEEVVAAQAIESALEAATPGLEALVESEVRAAHARARDMARWRTMGEAEEQIAALLENYSWPEEHAKALLGEREQVLAAARLEAERILMHARADAEALIVEARTSAMQDMATLESQRQALFEETRQRAYAEGYTEGRAQADEEGARLLEEATDSLNRIRLALPRAVRESQDQLLQLALEVAERLVHAEIAVRPEIVLDTLDAALARVTDMESVILRVHPEDLPTVQGKEEQIRDLLAQVKKLEFQSSVKIARGGVFIETGSGTVDATIRTQISVLSEVFRNTQAELSEMIAPDPEAGS